jgi:hypothetical protein
MRATETRATTNAETTTMPYATHALELRRNNAADTIVLVRNNERVIGRWDATPAALRDFADLGQTPHVWDWNVEGDPDAATDPDAYGELVAWRADGFVEMEIVKADDYAHAMSRAG